MRIIIIFVTMPCNFAVQINVAVVVIVVVATQTLWRAIKKVDKYLRAHVHKNQTISAILGKCRKMDFAYILTTGRSL